MFKSSLKTAISFLFLISGQQVWSQESMSTPEMKSEAKTETRIEAKTFDSSTESGRSKFGVSLFSLGGAARAQLENTIDNNPSFYFFENYLQFSYRPEKDFRVAFRYSFNYSTSGVDKLGKVADDKADTRDMSLLMTFNNVFEDYMPSNVTYKFQPRLYLPTSEKSKAQGMITSLRLENEMKIYTAKYSNFRFWLNPHYFFQRSTAYLDDKGRARTTDMFQLKHGIDYNWSFHKTFSLVPGYEVEDSWSNASSANNKDEFRSTLIDYRLGLEIRVARPLKFTLGYGHRKDLIKTDQFEDSFTLMTNLNLY